MYLCMCECPYVCVYVGMYVCKCRKQAGRAGRAGRARSAAPTLIKDQVTEKLTKLICERRFKKKLKICIGQHKTLHHDV